MNRITAKTINIGNANSGEVTVSAAIQHMNDPNFNVTSGQDITFQATWTTAKGALTYTAGTEIDVDADNSLVATGNAAITLVADSISLPGANAITDSAGTVTLVQKTVGTPITISVAPPGDVLGLLPSDLDNITAGTLIIGNANSGLFTVSDPYHAASPTNLQLVSGGDVIVAGGQISTNGGTLLVSPGTNHSFQPLSAGTDVLASTTKINNGLAIAINGTNVDTDYTQLKATGVVNLNSIKLNLSGSYAANLGDVFTIVSAAAASAENSWSLNNGALLNLNGVTLRLNYTASTVTLTALGVAVIHAADLGGTYNGHPFPATGYVQGARRRISPRPSSLTISPPTRPSAIRWPGRRRLPETTCSWPHSPAMRNTHRRSPAHRSASESQSPR